MTIKVYANYYADVITEKEFLQRIEEVAKEYDENLTDFECFLDDNYTSMEIWEFGEDRKAEIIKDFHENNIERASDELEDVWHETILKI